MILGAEKVITDTLKRMNNYTKASDAERLQLAKRMSELNRKLSNSFTLKQKADIDQRKYTFLSKKQMITVFGEEGQLFTCNTNQYEQLIQLLI